MRAFNPAALFGAALGMQPDHIEDSCAVIHMPYDVSRTTCAESSTVVRSPG